MVTLGDSIFRGEIQLLHVTRGLNPLRMRRISGNTPECYQVSPLLPN